MVFNLTMERPPHEFNIYTYMYGGNLEMYNICTCIIGLLIEAHLFRSIEEDHECAYDHTLIDFSSAQGGDKGKIYCWRK